MGRIYSLSAHNDNTSGDVTGITKTPCRIKIHEYKQRQQADVRSWAISKQQRYRQARIMRQNCYLAQCWVFCFFFLSSQKKIVPQSNNLNKKEKVKKKESWQTNVLHCESVQKTGRREKRKTVPNKRSARLSLYPDNSLNKSSSLRPLHCSPVGVPWMSLVLVTMVTRVTSSIPVNRCRT